MKVKKISAANVEACSLPKLFDEEKIDFQPIQCVNWAEYPYKPKVNFRIAHTQNSILQMNLARSHWARGLHMAGPFERFRIRN